ncbi:MAG: hypothetical protein JRD89_21125 [Deltaproteobacteria bacterium]|nr:hypothetical protein [Deltaproteobacteria bacterium]
MTDEEKYTNTNTVVMTEDLDYYEDLSKYVNYHALKGVASCFIDKTCITET